MKITEAIRQLEYYYKEYGDINVKFDCPYCYRTTIPTKIEKVTISINLIKD